jgi:hypothetical protein
MFEYCRLFDGKINYIGEIEILSNDVGKINWYVDIRFNQQSHHATPLMIEYDSNQYVLTNKTSNVYGYSRAKKHYNMIPLHEIKDIKKKNTEIKLIGSEEDILFLKSSVEFREVISRLGIELKD